MDVTLEKGVGSMLIARGLVICCCFVIANTLVLAAGGSDETQEAQGAPLAERLGELQEELEALRGELGYAPHWDEAGLSVQQRMREFGAARAAGFDPGLTAWRLVAVPDELPAPFESPGSALLALANGLNLAGSLGTDTWEATFRVLLEGEDAATAVILAWGFKDDALFGADYRASLVRDADGWRIASLEQRHYCRRGIVDDLCL